MAQFDPMSLDSGYGTVDKYFTDELAKLGWNSPIVQANNAFNSVNPEDSGSVSATQMSPEFAKWAADNGISTSLYQGDDYNIMRLMQGDNMLGEQKYTTKDTLDKVAEVGIPLAIAIGSGGVLGQALGILPAGMSPVDPSTWSMGASGGTGGASGAGIGSEGIATLGSATPSAGGSVNAALMEAAAGAPGYGSSIASAAAGVPSGITAGQTAINAAMNPYLNALGKISPELASAAASGTGGLGSILGPAADAILPASVLEKMGGGDGSTGGLGALFGGGKGSGGSDWMKMLLPLLAGYASYKDAKKPQLTGYSGGIKPRTATQTVEQGKYGPISRTSYAAGGIAGAGVPRYLDSPHDGMEDKIDAHIDGKEPAALSGGEFVIPADVVSHLGNGNSDAGAQQLFQMMDRIREARTGTTEQGKQIKPDRFMPV